MAAGDGRGIRARRAVATVSEVSVVPGENDAEVRLPGRVRLHLIRAGIPSDDPIVPLIEGMVEIAEETRHHAASFAGELARMDERLAGEKKRMRDAVDECDAATRKLQATYGTMEIRVNNLIAQTVASMAGQVAEQMRDQMIIVERRHNRVVLWKRAGLLSAMVAVIFGVGFGAARYADRPAVRLLDQCLAHPLQDAQTGGLLCSMDMLRSRG